MQLNTKLNARVPMDRRTDTCRWVRARARGGDERADAAPGVGSPFVWGAASMDGGAHTSEIKSWSGTPLCAVNSWQGLRAVFIL